MRKFIFFISLILLIFSFPVYAEESIAYTAHCSDFGWLSEVSNGKIGGTTGKNKKLEAIKIRLINFSDSSEVVYSTHVQNIGWMDNVSNNSISGTTGEARQIEAIKIYLTGPANDKYDICYRSHIANYGWLDWTFNGQESGSTGLNTQMEAVEIQLIPKGSPLPGDSTRPLVTKNSLIKTKGIGYKAHVQDIGWQNYVFDGKTAGTTGLAKAIEGLQINLQNIPGDILYKTHVQNIGWMNEVKNGQLSGTTGRALHIEAISINLSNLQNETYDIYYRTHVADIGWLDWAKNGENSGSSGGNKAIEAIEIKLINKGDPAPGSTNRSYIDFKKLKSGGPSINGNLKVIGNQIVNQTGNTIQLKGVSTHGIAWYPQYINQTLFTELKNQWNANVIRLAMYTGENGGYCSGGNQAELKSLIDRGVNYATNADLYAIIDWHILSDGNPLTNIESSKAFFNEVSGKYKNYNNIIYEICNEPNGGTTWDQIKNYASQIIPIIRKNDPDALIIVGTPTWSQEVDKAVDNPINESNILYALHFYAGTHKENLRQTMINAYNQGLPIFVSEFGITDASGNGNLDIDSANAWIQELNERKISFVCWNLSNKNDSSALINPSITKISGFNQNDLSGQGQWLLGILKATNLNSGSENNSNEPGESNPSGPTISEEKINYKLDLVNSWSQDNRVFYQFSLTISNETQNPLNGWSTFIDFNQPIELSNYWNGNYSIQSNNLEISNVEYNGVINPQSSVDVGFIVSSGSNLNWNFK